jgi:hypothetical protein
MNVEIGAEAALFPEKEYINEIAVAVHKRLSVSIFHGKNCRSIEFLKKVTERNFTDSK